MRAETPAWIPRTFYKSRLIRKEINVNRLVSGSFIVIALAIAPALAAGQTSPKTYTVVDVGLLNGTAATRGNALAESSGGVYRVVGTTSISTGAISDGFYWDSVNRQITRIPAFSDGSRTNPRSVNNNGEVAGYAGMHGFYWNPSLSEPMELLPPAGWPGAQVRATSINDGGVIAGIIITTGAGSFPVVWRPGQGSAAAELPHPDPLTQTLCSTIDGIFVSGNGDIGGYVGKTGSTYAAVWRWNVDTTTYNGSFIDIPGASTSRVNSFSQNGNAAGYFNL